VINLVHVANTPDSYEARLTSRLDWELTRTARGICLVASSDPCFGVGSLNREGEREAGWGSFTSRKESLLARSVNTFIGSILVAPDIQLLG
jgi:hypothetical protein